MKSVNNKNGGEKNMKQKRTFITVVLVIAVLALGVAYANMEGFDLTITGTPTAAANDSNFKVVLSNPQSVAGNDVNKTDDLTPTVTGSVASGENVITATFTTADFTTAQDSATVKYTITNESDTLAAVLTAPAVSGDYDKFTVTANYTGKQATEGITIQPNQTATVEVTLTLKATPTAPVTDKLVTVTMGVTPTQPTA